MNLFLSRSQTISSFFFLLHFVLGSMELELTKTTTTKKPFFFFFFFLKEGQTERLLFPVSFGGLQERPTCVNFI